MDIIFDYLSKAGSLITSLTIVGGALITVYKYTVSKPKEKREQIQNKKLEDERNKTLEHVVVLMTEQLIPLNESITNLNHHLEESKRDRGNIHKILENTTHVVDVHEKRLDNHNDRLIVLETTTKGQRVYKELYKGDEQE